MDGVLVDEQERPMATTLEEFVSFAEFIRRAAVGQKDVPSLEDCLRLCREEQELAETVAAIKRGEENFAAGRCMSIEVAERRLRSEANSPADVP